MSTSSQVRSLELEAPASASSDGEYNNAIIYDDALSGSLNEFIGFRNGSYFIDVPEGQIDEFFRWNADYPNLISAHRGGFTTGFPENAIATFANTLTVAPALLEVDVRRTGDGEWILMHDEDLSRTTNGTGLVEETTLAEIKTLRLKDNEGNLTPYPVPTLEEALIWAEGRTILELDLKSDDFTDEVVEIITELDAEEQVRFITDSVEQATQVYEQNREIHLGLFMIPDNREAVLADIEAAPFSLEKVSAFTGTQPQPADFYEELHAQGIVAIQGLFGEQEAFDDTPIDELTDEQRELLFETVYASGGDAIASDYYQANAQLIGYPVSDAQDLAPIFGTLDNDILEAGSQQLVFAGSGDDLIDSASGKDNRLYAGTGNDTLIVGENSRLFGGEGRDRFFTTSGGNNAIAGGQDADQFWIATAEIPEAANTIADFISGEDVLGIAGLNIDFADLDITQAGNDVAISIDTQDLAILIDLNAGALSSNSFVFE